MNLSATHPYEGHRPEPQRFLCRGFTLRYRLVLDPQRALAFPCDDAGHVDMDKLTAEALNNYLFARVFVGKKFLAPEVHRVLCRSSRNL